MRNQGNLQPTSKVILISVACIALLTIDIQAFIFSAASISLGDRQINAQTTYIISLMRSYDDTLNPTSWDAASVPSSATATVIFPSEFAATQLNAYSCDSILVNSNSVTGFTCSLSGNTVTVSNLFTGSDLVSDVQITLSNIVNPFSALTTSPFIGTIDSDSSSNSVSADVTFTQGTIQGLAINFKGGIVNRTSDMIISFTTANYVPSNGLLTIQFPATLVWSRELSSNHLIPFNGTLSCYGLTPEIANSTIECKGSYSTKIVTVSTFLSATILANKAVSLGIVGLFAPPTTQPIDSLTVSTCDSNLNTIDTQFASITGLIAQSLSPYSMQSSLAVPMGVNNFVGGLTFSFGLSDTISFRDYFLITFPSGTTITYTQSTSTIKLLSTTYTSSNQSLVIIQNTSNSNYLSGTQVNITFIRYKAPPSTKPSGTITFTVMNSGYAKMTASATITAIASNYTLTVAAASSVVNVYTSYTFTFTMSDALTSTGYFVLILDPNLCISNSQKTTITTNLSITISGTSIKSSPSTQITPTTVNGVSTYQLLLSNLNTSSSNIPIQTVTITVSNILNPSAVTTLTSFSISTYYSSSADLVANANYAGSIIMQTGNITLNSISSSVTTTYTFTTISVVLKITNPISSNGYIMVAIPSEITLLSASKGFTYISSSLITSTYTNFISNNTILLQVSPSIAAASTITINLNNIMTQNTTKTTSTFVVSTFDSTFSAIDQSTNSLGLAVSSGNNFNSLTIQRGNSVNSNATNYTITFEQIQSYTSVSVVTFKFNNYLSLSSLSRVFEVTSSATVPCLFTKVNNTYLQVTLSQKATSQHTIIIQKVINPPSEAPLTLPIMVTTSTSNFLYTYSQMYTQDIINTDPSSLSVNSFAFRNYVYGELTNLELSLTTLTNWPAQTYQLVINIPIEFDLSSAVCSSDISLLGCSFFAPTHTLTVSMTNSAALPLNIIFSIDSLIAPSYGSLSQPFILATFDANGYGIQTDSSTVIIVNNCSLNCRTCSSSNNSACLTCYSSSVINQKLLNGQSCVAVCPSASYQSNLTCIDCSSQCLTCSLSSSNCSTCSNDTTPFYYFNASLAMGNCLSSCSLGTFQLNQTCFDCSHVCASCNSTSYCFYCHSPNLYFEGSCLLTCPNNTLTNSTNSSCTLCQYPCQSCQDKPSFCLSCVPGTLLFNSTCSSSCPLPNLFVSSNQTCDPCDSLCLTCYLVATNCTSCSLSSNFSHLYSNTCLTSCPDLYYSNLTTAKCQPCSSLGIGCSNCSSSSKCLSCDPGYFYLSANQSCLNSTPTGYFNTNGSLYTCNSTCNSCSLSSTNCTSCIGNLSLYQDQCISACPLNLTVPINNLCQYCTYPCSTCMNSTSKCLSCALNSSLFYDSSNFACVNSTSCPNSTYSDNSSYACSSCNLSCALCTGSSTNCSKCSPSYYLFLSNNSCSISCPNGTVQANSTEGGICQTCTYPCLTCSGAVSFCLSCSQDNSTLFLNNNGTCVGNSSCQVGAYANASNFICSSCVFPCSTCQSISFCLSCQTNFSLIEFNNTCTNNCPSTYAPADVNGSSVCTPCNYPCSTCSSSINNCTACESNSSLYLQGSQCVNATSCQTGTYANLTSNVCQHCPISCTSCNHLLNCSACSSNYYFDTKTNLCVIADQCENGTVSGYNSTSGRNQCLSCSSPCQTCSTNVTSCTSCLQSNISLFVLNNSCVNASACPNGTFADQVTLTCSSCTSPCSKCLNQTACLACINDYFLNGSRCLSLCPNGTYVVNQSGVISCSSCNSLCSTCSSSSLNCTSCNGNTYLFNNSCVNSSACPPGTFSDANANACTNCTSPCGSCLNSTYCQSCYLNKSIDLTSGTCYSICPNGTVSMNASGVDTCVACSSQCANCVSNINFCSSCSNSSQYHFNGSCYDPSSCPNGTFSDSINSTCVACSPPCHFCSNNSQCTTCLQGFYLLNSTCSSVCPNGTVSVNASTTGLCQACSSPCGTCTNSISNCTSCVQDNINQLYYYNNTCYNTSSCPQKTYSDNITLSCKLCVSPCLQCLAVSLCSSCVTGFYYAQNNTCLSACPIGTLAINSTSGGVCSACIYPCSKCSFSLTNCTSCSQTNQTLYLSNGSCVANTSCTNGSYANATTLKCETCISQCSACSTNQVCTTCSVGFYLSNSSCITICPNGTLAQNVSYGGACQPCLYPCLTCSNVLTNCKSCSQLNSTLYLSNATCVSDSSCANGTYPNSTTFKCQTCQPVCSSCAALGACLTCSPGYYFYNLTCKAGCPNGTLAENSTSGGVCQSCTYPCSQCSGILTNCSVCLQTNSTLFLSNGACVSNNSCLNGTYANSTTLKCEICVPACSSCLSYSVCNACSSGFYLSGSSCTTACPNGTVADNSTRSCVNCLPPCNFCTISQTNCLSCLSPLLYYQANHSCLQVCPDFYYANTTTLQCKPCLTPCSTCSSITSCQSCATGYYLFTNNSCLASCPNGFYNNNISSTCSPCTNNCKNCLSPTLCTSCSPPYLLNSDICSSSCPSTAIYNISNTCQNCASALVGCLSCNSTGLNNPICTICDSNLVLSQGKCQSASSEAQGTLTGSLRISSIFPLPFTITGSIIFIACFMSKLQNKNSYVVGTAYSLFGFIQSACLVYTIIIYHIYIANSVATLDYQIYLQAALLVIGGLNIFGLFVQTYQLSQDQKFGKWTRSKCNFSCYVVVTILSCLFNYKFKMLIFTKLFSFYCLRAQLESVQKFKLFNVMSFLGVGHEGLVIYISAIIMTALPPQQQTFLSFLDLIIVNILNIVLALAVSSKEQSFFEEEEDDGIKINKVFNAYDSYDVNHIEGDDQKKVNKKQKGLQSRDIMMDDDDQFTLSISDRDSANINEQTNAKIVPDMNSINRNKSAILQSESSHDHQQTGNSLKRPKGNQPSLDINSNNFSAVYQGDLSRQKRKKFEESHQLSKQIALKSKNFESAQKLGQIMEENPIENKPQNIFDVGAEIEEQIPDTNIMFFETQNVQKIQQNIASAQGDAHEQQIFNEFQQGQNINEQKNVQSLSKEYQSDQMAEKQEINATGLNPSKSQAAIMHVARQIKVYKGKQIADNQADDIEQIDLTISKKQRELIELRKSIRKKQRERERSQDRKSRKNRSSSKDKRSKDAMSQLGLMPPKSKDNLTSRGEQPSSRLQIIQQHMQSSKLEVDEQLIAPMTMSPHRNTKVQTNRQNTDAIKEQIIVTNNEKNVTKQQNLQSSIIIDQVKQVKIQNQKPIESDPIDQINIAKSALLNQEKQQNIHSISNNFFESNQPNSTILKPNTESGNLVSVKDNNRSQQMPIRNMKVNYQKLDKQLDSKYVISPRGQQFQYDIQEMNYDFVDPDREEIKQQQNIFEYKKQENSFFSEEPSQQQRHKLAGFISKPHRKIQAQNQDEKQSHDGRLQYNVVADSENNPLDNKLRRISKQSIYSGNTSRNNNEDALDQMVDKTSRNQISKNRSHLIRKNDEFQRQSSLDRKNSQARAIPTQQSRVYQDLNDALTIREASEKELTQRRLIMNRPPMQNQRPATTEKSRMYIAGLKQMQGQEHVNTLRSSLDSTSLKNNAIPPKTSYDMNFRGLKSKELQQQGESRFDAYPSSFSSNRIQLASEELSIQPNKPLVSKTVRRKQSGEYEKFEQNNLNDSFARKSMKSYKSRSIDRNEYQQQNLSNSRKKSTNREENQNQDLNQYYKKNRDSPSNKSRKSRSRSKSRQGNRSSDKRISQLQKIYLQRLQFKK